MSSASRSEEIAEALQEQDAAWCAGDAAAFARRVTDDAVFTNIFGQQFTGREAFETQHAFIFGSIYAGSKLSQRIAHLRFIGGDLALVDTDAEVRDGKAMPPWLAAGDGVLRTKLLQVLVRTGGEWRVSAFHNVAVNPPRGQGPGLP